MGCGACDSIYNFLGIIFGYVVQFFYEIFQNYGIAIILFTVVTRLLMFPLSVKQLKTSAAQARLQPKLNELRNKYGNDKVAYNEALQELYTKEGVSPSAGCLPMLIQFPLFLGMYQAISRPLTCVLHMSKDVINKLLGVIGISTDTKGYYEVDAIKKLRDILNHMVNTGMVSGSDVSASNVVSNAVVSESVVSASSVASASDVMAGVDAQALINILGDDFGNVHKMCNAFQFLGIDLLQTAAFWNGALIIAVLVFICQVGSMMISNKLNNMQANQGGCNMNVMAIGMGGFSLFLAFTLPAAFPLYWLTSSLLAPIQTWVSREFFGPVIINAKAEAQRNARMRLEEKAIIDEVNKKKGAITLAPAEPTERTGGEGTGGSSVKQANASRKSSKKGNNNRGKSSGSDYMGKKK